MKKFLYSVYDKVAQVYQNPWIESCDQTAARAFSIALADEGSVFNLCPTDFILYRVGQFNDVTGVFCDCELPVKVLDGHEVKSDE